MTAPEGTLTAAQFEIMELIWNSSEGLAIGEIWDAIRARRDISRTTVLNLVGRLEKRNWLKRRKVQDVYRYFATVTRPVAQEQLALGFMQDFFAGSARNLVMSLLGSKRISKSDLANLKKLVHESEVEARQKRSTS